MKARFLVIGLILSGLLVAAYQSIACEEPPPPPPNREAYAVIKTEDNIKYAIVDSAVTLDGTNSSDADGGGVNGIYKFEWDWTNDGEYDNSETYPGCDGKYDHTYTQAGTYVVRLRVTGNESYDIDTDICCVHIVSDSDSDDMPDGWENYYGLNPALDDSGYDPDDYDFTNIQEYTNGTNPVSSDSDDYDIVAELIAKTMRAYQSRYRYKYDEDFVPWPNNEGSSGGPDYPSDGYYQGHCGASHPANAINLISYIVNRFRGDYYPIRHEFVRDDYWDPTLVKDSGGESCSSQWTYNYYPKYSFDPEFENIPFAGYNVTSSNYRAVLGELNRVITEQFNVRFPKDPPSYTSSARKYGISWYIDVCDEMDCTEAQSYPDNTCDLDENAPWPSEWESVPGGISNTPRVKEWTSWMNPFENGFRAEKEVVRGKITCDLRGDTGSADCYVQLKPPYSDTDNYSNIEPGFPETEYWQDYDSPTIDEVWTSSDYFGDFTPDHTGCYFGWRYGGGVSYDGNLDYSYPRNHHGWELATTVLIKPVFSEE